MCIKVDDRFEWGTQTEFSDPIVSVSVEMVNDDVPRQLTRYLRINRLSNLVRTPIKCVLQVDQSALPPF